ncbi:MULTISPECIES: hypothetical protein [Candidatus Ichthyocystis]|uniref:Putative coiled coil protein n=1 Tax=Candidatus Ichthyocystis hellenicum TaxID=1561003 RepID=A0A0S4M2Z7_9BURK|nr:MULTISPECIES: hypothetical protein [Ichthyocystis]CUT18147.1 putative coiled coil protein [Candidatus Ichthyocystis hellenicum]
MSKINFFNPYSLLKLSVKSIFGINCDKAIDFLVQLPHNEVFEAALLLNRRKISFSMYEPVYQPISEYVSAVCPFPDSWTEFCQQSNNLSSNPKEFTSLLDLLNKINKISCDVDRLIRDKSKFLTVVSCGDIPKLLTPMLYRIDTLIYDLEKSQFKMRKPFHYLVEILFLQLKYSFLPLEKILYLSPLRRILFGASDHLNNLINDLKMLKSTIFPIMHICSFVSLEDMMEMFHRSGSVLSNDNISMASSFLRIKYPPLIATRKLRLDLILKGTNISCEDSSNKQLVTKSHLDRISNLVKKLEREIKEMEEFMKKLPEECSVTKKAKFT